jgi:hypothetical protein
VNFRITGDLVSGGGSPYNIGSVIELERLSDLQLAAMDARGRLDFAVKLPFNTNSVTHYLTNHSMDQLEQATLRHKKL